METPTETDEAPTAVRFASLRRWASRSVDPVFGAVVAAWSVVFGRLVYLRHHRFSTFGFDLGIFDQATWLLSRGETFITVRGLEFFGHHGSFGFFALVPLYWLGGGPHLLNLIQVATLAASSVLVARAATKLGLERWPAVLLGIAFLAHFSTGWLVQETFHPEVMAIAPFLLAWIAAIDKRWRAFAVWLAIAVSWKEDVALAAMMLGVVLAIRGERRIGIQTAAISFAWFVFVSQILVPMVSPEGAFYTQFYGHLGETPAALVDTTLTNPTQITGQLQDANALGYGFELLAPFSLTALLSPLMLLVGLPQAVLNLLSINDFTYNPHLHYVALPLLATTMAMVEGVSGRSTRRAQRLLATAAVAGATWSAVAWGIGPGSVNYPGDHWPVEPIRIQSIAEQAVAMPGDDDSVAASYTLVPHLTHRREIYEWPNPFVQHNWGVRDENPPGHDSVDWFILAEDTLGEFDRALADLVAAGDYGGEWELTILRAPGMDEGILVGRRLNADDD